MALACALVSSGCFPDDWDGQPYQPPSTGGSSFVIDTNDTGPALDPLVGTWVSEGSDLSDLFAAFPFEYQSIEATFRADGVVNTEIIDGDGVRYVTTGTYTADAATTPGAILLQQVEPYEATLSGIYQVRGDELTYEVVQVSPDYGFIPPTPESGFGTTAGPSLSPGINVQTFERAR
jgi:hypothetical protein